MEYYKSNALYEYIAEKHLPHFRYVVGNAWQIVYGDNLCQPLLLIFAVGVTISEIDNPPSRDEMNAFCLLSIVGTNAKLPVRYVRFACDIDEIEEVRVSDSSFVYSSLTMSKLSQLYGSFGLPVSNTPTLKYLNDRVASAYHNWQRSSLGAGLTVTDIDLWRLSDTGKPEIVFELKRSYYDLKRWEPFPDDYRNFKLISCLCNKAGMLFKIIYNQRIKTPFEDKIDKLKIFSVDFSKHPSIKEDGIIVLKELENI